MSSASTRLGVGVRFLLAAFFVLLRVAAQAAQAPQASGDYVIGAQDVLAIAVFDQADLGGKYTVESDGTFSFPLIGRIRAGGLTLRQFEAQLRKLLADGFFTNPQVSVGVEQYKSQRIFIVGEVRAPGSYPLTGDMNLIEALARAGVTNIGASNEIVIVRTPNATKPTLPGQDASASVITVNVKDLQSGRVSENVALHDGDTVFVPRAESIYVFGQVKNPGAYGIQKDTTTVLQSLSLAGGVTEGGAMNRIRIVRVENGEKKEIRVKLTDLVKPGDTIIVPERYF